MGTVFSVINPVGKKRTYFSFINLLADLFVSGPVNPIRMQPLSPLILPTKVDGLQFVSSLSDNKGNLNTSQCASVRVVLVFSPDVHCVSAGSVSLFSPGKSPRSSCPYQCADSPFTARLGCILYDSSTEVAVICQDFNKIKPPTRPLGERQWGKISCLLWYGNRGHRH